MSPKDQLILFVDDEHASRVVFEQSFGKRFYVQCVASGAAALEVMKRRPVAVLVTDQRMPDMSGDELLTRVKAISPETIRIIVTAYSDLEPILRAVNEGLVMRYLIKPWDRAELGEILRWALEAFEMSRADSAIQLRLMQTERLMTLGQATAAVVHDLRQPLASIMANVSHLASLATAAPALGRLADPASGITLSKDARHKLQALAVDLPELAEELRSSSHFMNDVLMQLTHFRDREPASEDIGSIDPATLVARAIAMCKQEAVQHRANVDSDVPASLPRLRAPTASILQILINLIRNAQQAVGEKPAGGRVDVHVAAREDAVVFAITDDGPGMTPDVVDKLGTQFFTTRADGTGLGLAQVRRLLGVLRSKLDVQSTPGKGTTMTFAISRAE